MNAENYLLNALALATQTQGACAPNPAVGAVIVKNNRIIGEGFHRGPGSAHAEVDAFEHARESPAEGTLFVTLEPCCHVGRTPPCVDRIIHEKIKTVYFGWYDPNPIVAGKGIERLQAAGITCHYLSLPEISEFYRAYTHWHHTQTPWVTAKLALSLDGKIAGDKGQREMITGKEALYFTHQQRQKADAILTTAITINQDNPQLNVRLENSIFAKKLYIIDRQLQINPDALVFNTASQITIFHDASITPSRSLGNHVLFKAIPLTENSQLNLNAIIREIGQAGIHDLWVETGSTCFMGLLTQQLVNKVYIYLSLKLLGKNATNAFEEKSELLQHAKSIRWFSLGNDAACEMVF
ncbi:MAG: bifunctional diaminohydroxyphosphoribosylaminopyrimidine deaminase/5-amino-6-(5-phosphoribosylamino)uracil reductase RibD [Legionellales bacterium]|nr:bifunctional diaminohydroxyphosphoribosylaminopyrimidine deaminase/5-amino-6-(5-phosphoribosylamino)uracil reductase RibD [Legionellales bacterium]